MFKIINHYLRKRFEKFYFKSHWHLILDLSLSIVILMLIIILGFIYWYKPSMPVIDAYLRPTVDLNNPPLNLEIIPEKESINLSDGSILKIIINNNGKSEASNLNLSLETSDNNFSIRKIENLKNDSNINVNNELVGLSDIGAGVSREAYIKVYFNSKGEERTINWKARNSYNVGSQILKKDINLPSLKLKASISVHDVAYYTSPQGDQLGVGPVPPIVGIPTSYWIFFEANSRSNWKNFVLSARLPNGIELTDKRSVLSGEFNYNSGSRQIVWKIPEFKGQADNYRLGFEVQLVPTPSQLGKSLTLLSSPVYFANDSLTGEDASGTLDGLSTNLDQDRFNSGQGKVVAE